MPLWDITLPVHAAVPPWPGDIPFSRELSCSIDNGDECNVSNLQFCSHFGTHLDVPFHFEPDGIKLDEIPIDVLIGPVLVHEVSSRDLITVDDLPSNIHQYQRIIFKTNNTSFIADETFHEEFVSLSREVAQVLVDHHYVL